MSEMEPEDTPVGRLQLALVGFAGCVGEAVEGVCSYGLTIGESYVPFAPDEDDECEPDEEACTQLWVRVTGVTSTPSGDAESWSGDSCSVSLTMGLEVGILRCFDIEAEGEAPTATQVLEAALVAIEDMNTIQCAALGCDVWDAIRIGAWTPAGPLGGQYGGVWTFSVDLD